MLSQTPLSFIEWHTFYPERVRLCVNHIKQIFELFQFQIGNYF